MGSSEDLELEFASEKHTESAGRKSVENDYPQPFKEEVKKSSCWPVYNGQLENIKTSKKVFEAAPIRSPRSRLFAVETAYFYIPL